MKILVIDDEQDICEVITITFNLRWPGVTVITASTAKQALELVLREKPDFTILDIGLPDIDGFELCAQLRQISDMPILILSARNSELDKVRGLEMGADDYITKPFSHLELLARVKAILRRRSSPFVGVSEPPYEKGDLFIDFGAREIRVKGRSLKLPPLEYSLLYHLVKNPNRVIPHKTLLAKVWGREYAEQVDYLKVHVQRLRSKLEEDPQRPQMIVTERGVGYRFVEPTGQVASRP